MVEYLVKSPPSSHSSPVSNTFKGSDDSAKETKTPSVVRKIKEALKRGLTSCCCGKAEFDHDDGPNMPTKVPEERLMKMIRVVPAPLTLPRQSSLHYKEGEWSKLFSIGRETILRRSVTIHTNEPASFIKTFSLFGDKDGSLRLQVGFAADGKPHQAPFTDEDRKEIRLKSHILADFLKAKGMTKGIYPDCVIGVQITDLKALRTMFRLVKNHIEPSYQALFQKIIREGKHAYIEVL